MSRRSVAGTITVAMTCALVGLPGAAATAAPSVGAVNQPVALLRAPGAGDSSLGGLTVTGTQMSGMAPGFDPDTHVYQVVDEDDGTAIVTPSVGTVGATAVVTAASVVYPLVAGSASVPLTRNRNDIVVTVTSANSSSTSTYRVSVWRLAAPIPRIVSLANAHSTLHGGTQMTITLADGALPDGCVRGNYIVGDLYLSVESSVFDPVTGLTKETVFLRTQYDGIAGTQDLAVRNNCTLPGGTYVEATTTLDDAVTFTGGYPVDRADVPATVTAGSKIVFYGLDVNQRASAAGYWMEDANGVRSALEVWRRWTGNGNVVTYVPYPWDNPPWNQGSGPRTVHAGSCPIYDLARMGGSELDECVSTFSAPISWVTPAISNVSFSPSSGPLAGGTVIRLKGRMLLSGAAQDSLTITIGDQPAGKWNYIFQANGDNPWDQTFESLTQDLDVVEFTAPPAVVPGPVQITVTNSIGTAVARGTFTYSARPTITSISPATVANSGGSVITILGTDFGTAGQPTVIIGAVKSPSVTRVSATRLTAVVPASADTGAVNVTVASSQGGGISTPATLTLAGPTTLPTVTLLAPASGRVGDTITVTGTGFGAPGTIGVSVDGRWARVTASTATRITFEVPATDTTGVKNVVVGATTGAVTKTAAFTVLADAAITSVSPATVPSYAIGSAAKVTLTGNGFGTGGTVKVGSAAAVGYTATGGGTQIANVVVPTSVAGSLAVIVTPTGSTSPLRAIVLITAPAITYVGPAPHDVNYGPANLNTGEFGQVLDVPLGGGTAMRIEGTGFGPSGTLRMGGTAIATTSWTGTLITFTAPAHAAGTLDFAVTPANSSLSATQAGAVTYVVAAGAQPSILRIASVPSLHPDPNEFNPISDVSDAFTVTGTNLAGVTASTVRVVVTDDSDTFTVVPTAVTAGSLKFAAPRNFAAGGWKKVRVVTDQGTDLLSHGLWYPNAGAALTISPTTGFCMRSITLANGVSYQPAVVTVGNSGTAFGATGAVSIDGVAVTTSSYTSGAITFSMAGLAQELTNPWGAKAIVITPTNTALVTQRIGFTCGVTPTVTTTATPSTVAAGTPYTLGYTTSGFIGATPFTATAPGDYEYVTAATFGSNGFDGNVQAGAPVGAGDYYVRVAVARATFARDRYLAFQAEPVHVVITGLPVTLTAVSDNGSSFPYQGQLVSPADVHYTATATIYPITKVYWEYRNSTCENQGPSDYWTDGLPKDVALAPSYCGGDDITRSSWDVRVKYIEMTANGVDRSIYYLVTSVPTRITINPRPLTVTAVRADRVYDGTTTAVFGDLTVTGALDGETISLADGASGTFDDAAPGVNKPVTLAGDLVLDGTANKNYALVNPQPTIVGTITKAAAVLGLAAAPSSVLLALGTPITITTTLTDPRTGNAVAPEANAEPVVLTSQTPLICSVSGTDVTALDAGTCIIAGTEAASVNYLAATAASDDSSATETVEITILPAAQTISVIADDLIVAVDDPINPTSQMSGLFEGDTIGGVDYDYYDSGNTLLPGAPTNPGTYRVVPKGGSLTAASALAYTSTTSFVYVAGTLVITALPPVITTVSPAGGPIAGGTTVTVTGAHLDTVRSIRIGTVTLRQGQFTVNEDGTALTFAAPPVDAIQVVDLVLVAGAATAAEVYSYTDEVVGMPPGAPIGVSTVAGDQRLTIAFSPPTFTGSTPIASYEISVDGGVNWSTLTTSAGPGGTRVASLTDLQNGVPFAFLVRAVNSFAAGPPSLPATGTPTAPVITPALPPTITAVSPLTGPTIGGTTVTVIGARFGKVRSVRIGAVTLTSGDFAVNQAGTSLTFTAPPVETAGAVSLVVSGDDGGATAVYTYTYTAPPVEVVVTPPGTPTGVRTIIGNQRLLVVFTPPTFTGGAPITAYQVSLDGGRSWRSVPTSDGTGDTRFAALEGLQNGVTYGVQVRAVNTRYPSLASAVASGVPNSPVLPPVAHPPTQVPVPANPDAYRGRPKYTRALNTTFRGTTARPITTLGTHQLTVWEAATLSKKGLFAFDSAVLTPMGRAEVKLLAAHLRLAHAVTCEGYTDYAGQDAHELTLSRGRALAVCKALIQYGAHVRIAIHGYGDARPVIIGGTAESREANRRVVVQVTA